jgi:hypothetical protein
MACPECGCKETYQYNGADFGVDDEHLQRCAACGHIFDIEDSADEGDEHEESSTATHGVSLLDSKVFRSPATHGPSEQKEGGNV